MTDKLSAAEIEQLEQLMRELNITELTELIDLFDLMIEVLDDAIIELIEAVPPFHIWGEAQCAA